MIHLQDEIEAMQREIKEAVELVKACDRRLKALEQVAFGDGKPKKKTTK